MSTVTRSTTPNISALAVLHLADLYRNPKMEIPSIKDWSKIPLFLSGSWPRPMPTYRTETAASNCREWIERAKQARYVVIDTEYATESRFLFLLGMGAPNGSVLQFDHREAGWSDRAELSHLLKSLVGTTPVVFQNAVADIPVIEQAYGIRYTDYKHIDDTMLAHAVLWSDWPHTLEFLASVYGEHNKMKHLAGTDMALYNAGDVVDTIAVWEALQSEFRGDPASKSVYENQSLRTVPITLRSMHTGLRVNVARVTEAMRELSDRKVWASSIAAAYAGWPINIGSDDQLKFQLYDNEGLPVQCVPRTDKRTVDADAIAALRATNGPGFDAEEEAKNGLDPDGALRLIESGAHPLLEARVVYAAAQQSLSHYITPLIGKDNVHPQFSVHAQASGRWSTTDPPMAQIPRDLQDIVMPHPGEMWIEFDWDQIELRILAALSGDEVYEQGFREGWDIHTLNACDIFKWPYPSDRRSPHGSEVDAGWRDDIKWLGKDDPRRRFAKVFVFRLNYGGEARTATDIPGVKQLGLRASDLVDGSRAYLSKHPRIRQYWESITRDGISRREVRTFCGRRRRLLVDSKSAMKRLIYNHPMQGGVSDIFNLTLIKIASACPWATFKYGVHDAQKWGTPIERYDETYRIIHDIVHTPWTINGKSVIFPATFKQKGA